jgi:hypothetical protein
MPTDYVEIFQYGLPKAILCNPEDVGLIMSCRWCIQKGYHSRSNYSKLSTYKFNRLKPLSIQKFILGFVSEDGIIVDHINHNTYDNRKSNLRICSIRQNICNSRKSSKPSSSKYKGVWWCKKTKKWKAGIKVYGRSKCLGTFNSQIQAAKAYDDAAKTNFKEFACLNFPTPESLLEALKLEAQEIQNKVNKEFNPNGVVSDVKNEDSRAPSTSSSTGRIASAFNRYLPGISNASNATILPNEQARADASLAVSPQYSALQAALYDVFGRDLNRVGNEIGAENIAAQVQSDLDLLRGTGRDAVQAAVDTNRIADPEFYNVRQNVGARLNDLLSPALSGAETEEITRALNRQRASEGSLSVPTAQSTVENAMTFGSALRDRLGSAIQTASASLPALRGGMDTTSLATGRATGPNTGESRFVGVQTGLGDQAQQTSNNFLQGVTGINMQRNDINANRRDFLDRANQTVSSLGDLV